MADINNSTRVELSTKDYRNKPDKFKCVRRNKNRIGGFIRRKRSHLFGNQEDFTDYSLKVDLEEWIIFQ